MKKIILALLTAALSLVAASAFATNCNDFVAGPNKVAAKYISTVGTGVFHNLYFNRKGNFTMDEETARSVNIDFTIKSYQLPADVVKKVFFRFTKADTMGKRNATGRMVCKFYYDFNDGYKSGSNYYILDVEPTSDYNVITAYYGPGEPRAGGSFDARTVAQTTLDGTIFNAIKDFPEYKAQMAKFN